MHLHSSNQGLANSIRGGIDRILETHDRTVVIEDDILVSNGFLNYMQNALRMHATDERVMSVCSYLPKLRWQFLLPHQFYHWLLWCWGWGTWKRAWEKAEWNPSTLLARIEGLSDGRLSFDMGGVYPFTSHLEANRDKTMTTWAIFWAATIYLNQGLCLYPHRSLIRNIGLDGSGENCGSFPTQRHLALPESFELNAKNVRPSKLGHLYLQECLRRESGHTKRKSLPLRIIGRLFPPQR